jgi:hypothetical protein
MNELNLKIEELEERIAPCAGSMANAFGVGAQGGMAHAMSTFGGVDNPNGDAGMFTSIGNSC